MALTSNPDWTSLPLDLLHSILDYLVPVEDYPTFSEVCPQWKHAVDGKLEDLRSNHKRHCRLHQQFPLLLAPTSNDFGEERFCLYDVMQEKSLLEFDFRMERRKCEGCSHDWLILVEDYKVILFNPISGKFIDLPPLERSMSNGGRSIFHPPPRRGVLSADPDDATSDDFVVMMRHNSYAYDPDHSRTTGIIRPDASRIIKHMIAFIRSEDEDWTYQELQDVEDIVYSNGLFYLLDRSGMLFSCEVKRDGYKLRQIPSHSLENPIGVIGSYLVESPEGDLLRVIQKYRDGFMVYKLLFLDSRNSIWEEVKILGDVALFLGDNHHSISVTASDFVGCQSNSIYYSQHFIHFRNRHPCSSKPILTFGPDEGSAYIFSLNDKTVTKLYPLRYPDYRQPLLWISPNFE